jgi:hypothetical protein
MVMEFRCIANRICRYNIVRTIWFFENSNNIVNIKDGKVGVDMKIVGDKRMPLVEIVEKYKPYLET